MLCDNLATTCLLMCVRHSVPGGLSMLKGYSFIEYFRKEDCDRALKGTQGIKLGNQEIEIRISGMFFCVFDLFFLSGHSHHACVFVPL